MSEQEQADDFLRDQLAALNAQARAIVAQTSALMRMYGAASVQQPVADSGPNYMGKED